MIDKQRAVYLERGPYGLGGGKTETSIGDYVRRSFYLTHPETRYSQSADPIAVTRYTLAVNRKFKREGEPTADFIPCVVFGKSAEFAEKYFAKGMMITIAGRIQVRAWEDQQGQRRWSTEIVVEEQCFAERKNQDTAQGGQAHTDTHDSRQRNSVPDDFDPLAGYNNMSFNIVDDDLPF